MWIVTKYEGPDGFYTSRHEHEEGEEEYAHPSDAYNVGEHTAPTEAEAIALEAQLLEEARASGLRVL